MTTKITPKQEIRDLLWKVMMNPADTPGVSFDKAAEALDERERNLVNQSMLVGATITLFVCLIIAIGVFWLDRHPAHPPVPVEQQLNDTLQIVPGREHADGTVEMRIMDDPPVAYVISEGQSDYLYYGDHIVASRPNDTWFWIVLDSAGYKASKAFMEYRGDSSVRKEEWRSTTRSAMVRREKEGKK